MAPPEEKFIAVEPASRNTGIEIFNALGGNSMIAKGVLRIKAFTGADLLEYACISIRIKLL
jgi:hypothetical protein